MFIFGAKTAISWPRLSRSLARPGVVIAWSLKLWALFFGIYVMHEALLVTATHFSPRLFRCDSVIQAILRIGKWESLSKELTNSLLIHDCSQPETAQLHPTNRTHYYRRRIVWPSSVYAKVCQMNSFASMVATCLWYARAADITTYEASIR